MKLTKTLIKEKQAQLVEVLLKLEKLGKDPAGSRKPKVGGWSFDCNRELSTAVDGNRKPAPKKGKP